MTKNKSNIKTNNVDSLSIAQGTGINNNDINDKSIPEKEKKDVTYINEDLAFNDESVLKDGIDLNKKRRKKLIIRGLRILFTIGFFVFLGLFINEVLIQPYRLKRSIEKARDLYHFEASTPTSLPNNIASSSDESDEDKSSVSDTDPLENVITTPTPDPNRDEKGRLRKFSSLLEVNEDVKGWIRIDNINGENDTKIDYVVVQSDFTDPEYYLSRDWATHDYLKAGSLFLDYTSSLEPYSQNLIIHGHNMTSSDDMFHYLLKYQEIDFLREHPIISFDTIFDEGLWKVFSVYITPGNNDRNDFFPFVKSSFANDRDYLEYLYQIRVRSLFNIDKVDINENDQILTLSTCSYELSNYRTIVVARKVRDGESIDVDTDSITKNKNALYPPSFYKHYGGKAPETPHFDVALEDGLIPWYNPIE